MARILLIEDEDILRRGLAKLLIQEGHLVLEAEDGMAGLALAQRELPDLVITDVLMPHKDGLEVIVELQRLIPGVRILSMSGGGTVPAPIYLRTARNMGSGYGLIKPFSVDEFQTAVRSLLSAPRAA